MRYSIVIIVLVLLGGCVNQEEKTVQSFATGDFCKDAWALPGYMAEDAKNTISRRDNQVLLLLAGGASVAMTQGPDEDIANHFSRRDSFHNLADRGLNLTGDPSFHFAATGLWYAVGAMKRDEVAINHSYIMMRALALTNIATVGLKAARDNETPAGDKWGWPSGHASSSFAVASVLDELYGRNVGIPAYVFASLVGWRMIDQRDHWASDVVFGAALGYVIGHTVAGENKQIEVAGFQVLPFVSADSAVPAGLCLVKRF
jgi:hypothetical protein